MQWENNRALREQNTVFECSKQIQGCSDATTTDVVALGELLIDFATLETDGSGYPAMKANPGGAPGNFLAALSAYGVTTAFLGKVGDDTFGHKLISTMAQAGIETSGICVDPAVFTTLAFVTFDHQGERSFSFARKPGADTQLHMEEVNCALMDEAKVFHFGTLSLTQEPVRSTTQQCVAYAKQCGKQISFDPNLRLPLWHSAEAARESILWGLHQADVVKISDEEVSFLWGCTPEEGADQLLRDFGVDLAMVTMGSRGCILKNNRAEVLLPCPRVHPVDTTGAGDIFGGSALARILELGKAPEVLTEEDLCYIGRYAVTAASLSTEKVGGIPSIPQKETVLQYLEQSANW